MLSLHHFAAAAALLACGQAVFAAPPDAPATEAPLFAAKTIQVTEIVSAPGPDGKLKPIARLSIAYAAPAKVHIDEYQAAPVGGFSTTPDLIIADDGKTLYQYQAVKKQYMKQAGDYAAGFPVGVHSAIVYDLGKSLGKQTIDGNSLMAYTSTTPEENGQIQTTETWVNPTTQLLYRRVNLVTQDKKSSVTSQIDYSDWSLDQPIAAAQFAWTPPAGVTEYIAPTLLADGSKAPDFTVQDKDGKPVKLSDYAGKVVVLDFWATSAAPCIASMPHMNAVAKKYADQGAVVLAVNVSDTKDAFEKWLPQNLQYSSIHFAYDPAESGKDVGSVLYHITEIPTEYIVGKDGKISHSIVGDDSASLELESAIQNALAPIQKNPAP